MAALVARIKDEPAVVIGIVATILVFAVKQFAGHGYFTPDTTENLINVIETLAPLLAGLATRGQVSPA